MVRYSFYSKGEHSPLGLNHTFSLQVSPELGRLVCRQVSIFRANYGQLQNSASDQSDHEDVFGVGSSLQPISTIKLQQLVLECLFFPGDDH